MRYFYLFLLISSTSFAGPIPNTIDAKLRRVVMIGDSITQTVVGGTVPWPKYVENGLGHGYATYNRGVSGDKSADALTRWTTSGNAQFGVVVEGPIRSRSPNGWYAVVINLGINDMAIYDVPVSTVVANIQTIVTQAEADGAYVLICNTTPFKGNVNWSSTRQTNQDSLKTQLAALVSTAPTKRRLVDIYSELVDPANPNTLLSSYNSGDWMHPNQSGANKIGDKVLAVLNTLP